MFDKLKQSYPSSIIVFLSFLMLLAVWVAIILYVDFSRRTNGRKSVFKIVVLVGILITATFACSIIDHIELWYQYLLELICALALASVCICLHANPPSGITNIAE